MKRRRLRALSEQGILSEQRTLQKIGPKSRPNQVAWQFLEVIADAIADAMVSMGNSRLQGAFDISRSRRGSGAIETDAGIVNVRVTSGGGASGGTVAPILDVWLEGAGLTRHGTRWEVRDSDTIEDVASELLFSLEAVA